MKVLIIGGGGREHAIAWRLAQEPNVQLWAAPGNPGIAQLATCLAPPNATPQGHLAIAASIQPDLTIVGPESPLVAGVVDAFRAQGFAIVGPAQAAAQLEASKVFSKHVMFEAGIPTAAYRVATSLPEALQALDAFTYPVVLKADGLAAGKGVVIAGGRDEAATALRSLSSTLGPKIVIEEFLEGEEVSFIVLSDGRTALPLEASQDHKTIYDNDTGPNTGGMGAYCDGRILSATQSAEVMDTIINPTIAYMRSQNTPFTGFLYAGLMMTAAGPKVLEFNVRLGDPETQSLLHRIRGGFLNALVASAAGSLAQSALDWSPDPSVCVVLAAYGYPSTPRIGDPITGIPEAESSGATVFHAGTVCPASTLNTAGGRVLGVTASGPNLAAAIANTYAAASHIHFDGMQRRSDIGRKGLKRWPAEEALHAGGH